MTPAYRKHPRPVGPVLPMTAHDARYPHRVAIALAKFRRAPVRSSTIRAYGDGADQQGGGL